MPTRRLQPDTEHTANQSLVSGGDEHTFGREDDNDESLDHILMAVDLRKRGTVGCAYYIAREERLFAMEDIVSGGTEIIEKRK